MDVKTLCLGVLCDRDGISGYDIKKHFETAFSHFFLAGFGSIYPALAELAETGLVTCEPQPQQGRPDRKIYYLTDAGRAAFREALATTEPRHKVRSEFLVLMYFAHLMPEGRLREVLEQREREIETLLEAIGQRENNPDESMTPGQRFVTDYGRALLEAAREFTGRHRHLLRQAADKTATAVDDAHRKQA